MKNVTVNEFIKFHPCYSEEEIMEIAGEKTEWTALDVLNLEQVPIDDRLWAVIREEFIEAPILHEFACRCAERVLSRIKNPDPRLIKAIEAKRAWLLGKISDEELDAAREDSWDAAREDSWDAATYAVWSAATYAEMSWQIEELKRMLEGGEE